MNLEPRRFPFVPPPELRTGKVGTHPVVIVGAGSVGLTLALALARQGVRSVVLEKKDCVTEGSRALGMSRRTMEIWEALGAAGPMLEIGIPWNSGRSFYRGQTVLEFEIPHDPLIRHAPMLNIQQCVADEILLDAIADTGLVDVRWRNSLSSLNQHDVEVAARIDTPEGSYDLRSDYVVACDGGRSTVRSEMKLRMKGRTFESNYMIVDVRLDSDHPAERRAWFDPPSNPGSTVLMHKQPGGIWRLDYQLREGHDPSHMLDREAVERKVADHLEMIGETGEWSIEWMSTYRAHSLCLDSFRHGRVLFAGDAAHLIPIFGIRGLNSGVDDVWTLAWKLARTLRHAPGDGLLDSYSVERVAAAYENIAEADRSTRFMTPDSPGLRLMRDAVLSIALKDDSVSGIMNPRQGFPVSARTSPLNSHLHRSEEFVAGCRPGDSLPDLRVAAQTAGGDADRHLLSLLDPTAFTIIAFEPSAKEREALSQVAEEFGARTIQVGGEPTPAPGRWVGLADDGHLRQRLDAAPGSVYLVRPDHLVCARWRCIAPSEVWLALSQASNCDKEGMPT